MISIVVTCLNAQDHMPALTHDLSRLDTPEGEELEFIIVDGGSTDDTWKLLKAWDEPRKVLVRQPCNVSEGRNIGIIRASGHHVAITDADFRLPPYWITSFHARAEDDRTILGGHKLPIMDGSHLSIIQASLPINGPCLYEVPATPRRARWTGAIESTTEPYAAVTGNAYYPRKLLIDAGGFDPSLEAAEDGDLHTRCLSIGARIQSDPMLQAFHAPRKTWKSLWQQIKGYGRGQAMADLKSPANLRWGHLLPPTVLLVMPTLFAVGLLFDARWWIPVALAGIASYGLAFIWAVRVAWKYGRPGILPAAMWSWFMWQTVWGLGFLSGIVRHGRLKALQIRSEAMARV